MKSFLSALVLFVSLTAAPPAGAAAASRDSRDEAAEKFVQQFTGEIIRIVSQQNKGFTTRSLAIRKILQQRTAAQKIVIFMLGRYARKIDRAQLPVYMNLMEEYMMRIFINRILYSNNAHTAKITIVGSKKKGGREVVVTSNLHVAGLKEPLQIYWHLLRDPQVGFKLFNLGVEGFWLAQEQRSQFVNFIQQNGGDPKILLPYLKKKILQAEQDDKVRDVESLHQKRN